MNFNDIKIIAKKLYYPIFLLEDTISHGRRKKVELILRITSVLSFLTPSILYFLNMVVHLSNFDLYTQKIYAVSILLLSLWVIVIMLEAFYFSYIHLDEKKAQGIFIDFELAYTMYKMSPEDITATFFGSSMGSYFLMRCGISAEVFNEFLSKRKQILSNVNFKFNLDDNNITWEDFIASIFEQDKDLQIFLFQFSIQKKEVIEIIDWIIERNDAYLFAEWWWSKENLDHIPSIGQSWSYGQIYTLQKYRGALPMAMSARYEVHSSYGVDELKELESVLSRSRDANAILVGNDESGRLQIISHLARKIDEGSVSPELKHKTVVLLDTDSFVSQNGGKIQFELELSKILIEAISAGNIILVINNLPSFISSSKTLGVDLTTLIEPYLSSPNLQIIAISDTDNFHQIIEKNILLSQHFEKVLIKDIDTTNTIKVLENEIMRFEDSTIFFTYQSLVAISESAERYFSEGIMPDKAIDLLLEIVPKLKSLGKHLVEKEDILSLVKVKTGIPVGELTSEEKNKLLNLEKILHARIVGQDEAVVSISNAVRRSRSGIVNPNRPISSFLFLGPTGVGKTETTKALNDVFFGDQGHIMRLDMSEYSGAGALSKLIGSFETNQTGILSTMLREHQYGVLLLDEFEKTTEEVMNLFLQVLDEGFFSDNLGKKVNARNLIIIATSNAGSDLIWEAIKSGSDLSKSKEIIIDSLIKQGIFKPELLNRFDGVVLFQPLTGANLRQISKLMLDKLHNRLSGNGINLVVNDTLIEFVAGHGTDPKFGARPINRAIQEKVEQIIAKKLIDGSAEKGKGIILTKEELY